MPERPTLKFRPDLERLEMKLTLSVTAGASQPTQAPAVGGSQGSQGSRPSNGSVGGSHAFNNPSPAYAAKLAAQQSYAESHAYDNPRQAVTIPKPNYGYLTYRITNPNDFNNRLVPIVRNVPVQAIQPVPGRTYNILAITVRNGTKETFTASNSQFLVRVPPVLRTFPILTGDQVWKPGDIFVFYILSNKTYPLPSIDHSGFQFVLNGARSVDIPGPSGVFLRIKYNPATFDQTLDNLVKYTQGNQGGIGVHYGLPNTAVYEFVSSATERNDYAGYF